MRSELDQGLGVLWVVGCQEAPEKLVWMGVEGIGGSGADDVGLSTHIGQAGQAVTMARGARARAPCLKAGMWKPLVSGTFTTTATGASMWKVRARLLHVPRHCSMSH